MNILKCYSLCLSYSFLFLAVNLYSQEYAINGIVTDTETGKSLPGVNIYLPQTGTGTNTDPDGGYTIFLPEGKHKLVFSFVGYEGLEKEIVVNKNLQINAGLQKTTVQIDEVVVNSQESDQNIERTEMSTIYFRGETILNTPSFFGEVDILKIIQLLPGVQSAGDGNTGIFVRGGSSDQNLILFDEAVVFNASHLFNFFSIFNPDAVKDLKLYKGGIPSHYGGRLSSVLDIRMKDGNLNEFKFNGGIGLISSRMSIEGPLQRKKSGFMIAGRRTYADMFLKISNDENQRNTRLYFYDLNAKMNYVLNEKNRVDISGYFGHDVTAFRDIFAFDWGNAMGSLKWTSLFSEKFTGNFSLMYSNYDFNISGNIDPANFRWESSMNNLNLQTEFSWLSDKDKKFSFGINSIYHHLDPGIIKSGYGEVLFFSQHLSSENALEIGTYVSHELSMLDERIAIDYGVRLSVFQLIGPGIQYEYDKSNPGNWVATDTVYLKRNKFYNRHYNWEPRINLRVKLSQNSSVKAGFNRMTQYIQQAQSTQSVAPYDIWYMTNNNIPAQKADQIVVGYFRNFLSDKLETSIEFYYKDFSNVSDIIDNGKILGNELLESQLRIGEGWSYGSEIMIRGSIDRFNGFVGYTWAKTQRKIPGINHGRPYLAPFDRRHDLSLSINHDLSKKFIVSGNFIFSSGRAYTYPVGQMRYQGDSAPIYADRNSGNLPHYHRLDLSLNYMPGNKRGNNRFQSTWNFSLFNVYARVNPISVSFKRDAGMPGSSFFYIPGPIPAVSWNFSF